MSTAQDLPLGESAALFGEPATAPALRLVPAVPLDFDDAVTRVRPRLHRYAVRRLGDTHEAEELVQEALLRAYTHREQLLTEDDLSAWTTVVTGRLVIDRLRVRGRSTSVADVPEGSRIGRDTADVVVARDEARTALDALDAMPTRQASLLWAREVEGRSYDELCKRFGMTEPAVRSVLTRARKALRKEYALRGGTLPVGGLAVLAPWISGLTLAGKIRRLTTRISAPAALGAVGITALGGLILSPFGVAPSTAEAPYNPAQAVVTAYGAEPTAPHPTLGAIAAAGNVGTHPATAGTATTTGPHGWLAPAYRPLAPLSRVKCTQATDTGLVPTVMKGVPSGIGVGGSPCLGAHDVRVGPALPASSVTGYDHVSLGETWVSCTQLHPLTQPTNQVNCSETQP